MRTFADELGQSLPAPANEAAAYQRAASAFARPTVSMIIPTLNEAANLPHVLPKIPSWVGEVIIVDGRSTDRTVAVAREIRPDAKIVLETRHGKGAALAAGFRAATGDAIIMLDADGSMDPGEATLFLGALMSGAEFVKGSRFVQGGGTEDMSAFRMAGNWGLLKLVQLLHGARFSDLCYGYIAFWRWTLPLLNPDADGFEIETLLNLRAVAGGLTVKEVPSFEAHRVHGKSNLRAIPDGWRVLKTILRERTATRAARA